MSDRIHVELIRTRPGLGGTEFGPAVAGVLCREGDVGRVLEHAPSLAGWVRHSTALAPGLVVLLPGEPHPSERPARPMRIPRWSRRYASA